MATINTPQQSKKKLYTYSSKPKKISSQSLYRLEYLESEEHVRYENIMYDRRVMRGNTYAPTTLPLSQHPDPIEVQRQQEIKRRALAKRQVGKHLSVRPSPPRMDSKQNIEVQTELYLEAITNRAEEDDINTGVMFDQPPTPLFIPATISKGIETQIYRGDLFNFNVEVKPILEVMVGKTLNQSMIEILEEEELACLRRQQFEFEEVRNAEVLEMQRLEEQDRRYREEKKRRIEKRREALLQKERELTDKIAAIAFASSYLLDLVPNVFSCMRKNGYFCDPVERDIEQDFLPFIVKAGAVEVENKVVFHTVLDCIIWDVCLMRLDNYTVPDDGYVSPPPVPDFNVPDVEYSTVEENIQNKNNNINSKNNNMKNKNNNKKYIPLESDQKCPMVEETEDEYTYDGSC